MLIINPKVMATKRKTAKDYRKEYNDLLHEQGILQVQICERLLTLSKQFPEAIIDEYDMDIIRIENYDEDMLSIMGTDK